MQAAQHGAAGTWMRWSSTLRFCCREAMKEGGGAAGWENLFLAPLGAHARETEGREEGEGGRGWGCLSSESEPLDQPCCCCCVTGGMIT